MVEVHSIVQNSWQFCMGTTDRRAFETLRSPPVTPEGRAYSSQSPKLPLWLCRRAEHVILLKGQSFLHLFSMAYGQSATVRGDIFSWMTNPTDLILREQFAHRQRRTGNPSAAVPDTPLVFWPASIWRELRLLIFPKGALLSRRHRVGLELQFRHSSHLVNSFEWVISGFSWWRWALSTLQYHQSIKWFYGYVFREGNTIVVLDAS